MKNISDNLILIVDDSPTNINMLFNALNEFYEVTAAKDGESALNSISKNPPDLILLDVEMPGIDGYEVCRRLKSDEKTSPIPVIFITALSGIQDEARGLALGAVDFITKPFNTELVKARVKNHLITKKLLDEKETLIKQLKESLANVRTLKSLLPICATCKKVRDDDGYWSQVDSYISKNSDTKFSHGICPDCIKKLYPDIADDILREADKYNKAQNQVK